MTVIVYPHAPGTRSESPPTAPQVEELTINSTVVLTVVLDCCSSITTERYQTDICVALVVSSSKLIKSICPLLEDI